MASRASFETPTGVRVMPAGVRLRSFQPNLDERGALIEIFREEWPLGARPVQWNAVLSHPGVLRGVHVHARHDDYIALIRGRVTIGLSDLRRGSPTRGLGIFVDVDEEQPCALAIPAGVAHGIYTRESSVLMYGVSIYYDPDDEFVCDWADPTLGIGWPITEATVSDRDAGAAPLSVVLEQIEPWQPFEGTDG